MLETPIRQASVRPLLVFDGDCAFCTSSVNRLTSILPSMPASAPWQWLDLDALGLSAEDVANYAWLYLPKDRYRGHLALAGILRMQPRLGWRFLGNLLATPPFSWLGAVGYQLIARNRHRLPGGTPACQLKPAE